MFNLYYKILSYFPSKEGIEAFNSLTKYLKVNGGIDFTVRTVRDETGEYFVAESSNAYKKYIITSGKNLGELEDNIKDAIFTSFHVPRRYCNTEALISPINKEIKLRYATC
ncbi:MAG: hypothetical protein ABIG10_02310 [bacterium]